MCLVLAGLPDPDCNVAIGNEHFFLATPDLVYLLYHLVLEYEGDHHRTDAKQWDDDITRVRLLTKEGYAVERVTKQRLRRPRQLVQEVYAVLVERGYDGPPPDFAPAWLAHFEPHSSSEKVSGG